MCMVVTRYTERPLFKQYQRTLQQIEWKNADADLILAIHGPPTFSLPNEHPMIQEAATSDRIRCWDFRLDTNGRIPQLIHKCITRACNEGYKCIGFMDDDAYYPEPVQTVKDYLTAFTDPIVGGVGPMGSFRKFRRYVYEHNPIQFLNPLYRNPWAPLGSQIYNIAALYSFDFSFLKELKFRADAILALMLYANGWGNYEMDVPFHHVLSSGLDRAVTLDPEFHRLRIKQVHNDYEIYAREIHAQLPTLTHRDRDLRDKLLKEIVKLERSERNHHAKKLEKLNASI